MIKEIKMPAGGQTTDTSTVGTWLVKEGDKVDRGDPLLEIETDKATLTVESFTKGIILKILAESGEELEAGAILAYIGNENDKIEKKVDVNPKKQEIENSTEEDEYLPIEKGKIDNKISKKTSENESKIQAMPNAKKFAKEQGILLCDVSGYIGKKYVKKQDVLTYIDYMERQGTENKENTTDRIIPFTKKRKIIAQRMSESTQNIPAFTATVEVEMKQCIQFRKMANENKEGAKISYNDILFKCVEATVRKFPYVNASYTEKGIAIHEEINIGLAVAIEDGLVVPVVKNVEGKTISQIATENKKNVENARTGHLSLEEMSGGTITLSNLGMYPVVQFTAIVNPPEVCILAVGTMEEKPVFKDGEWKNTTVMKITGSFDHRVIDGAYGAGFLTELKRMIENPALALL